VSALETIAGLVASGAIPSDDDLRAVFASHDLITIGMMGDGVRRRIHGRRTTFVRVFEVHVDAPPASLPPRVAAGELRIVGRPSSFSAAVAATSAAVSLANAFVVTGFSMHDLEALAPAPAALRDALEELRVAGLDMVAELPLDAVRDPEACMAVAADAGVAPARLTIHSLAGMEGLAALFRARDLQRAVGLFKAFAPLPRRVPEAAPTTGYDDVKLVALARLVAVNIESIQVDWALYGPKLAQVALTVGADDVDGVASIDPGILGTRRSPIEEIRGNIKAAGLEPVERDGRFEIVGTEGTKGTEKRSTRRNGGTADVAE
jgi:aminodeoxyfutalosine synthase